MPKGSKLSWWTDPRQWLRVLLMLDDTPHAVALGAALGMFIALTPTVGVQMIIVLSLAVITRPLFRFNKTAALAAVYVSNPLTVIPIYWFDYLVGTMFFEKTVTREEFVNIFNEAAAGAWWASTKAIFVGLGAPLIVGSLIVATIGGLVTYPLIRRLLRPRYRRLIEKHKANISDEGNTNVPAKNEAGGPNRKREMPRAELKVQG